MSRLGKPTECLRCYFCYFCYFCYLRSPVCSLLYLNVDSCFYSTILTRVPYSGLFCACTLSHGPQFLNEKTGAGRLISGELLPTAGRVEALDDVIQAHKSTGKQVDDPALGEAIAVVVADLMDESDRAKAERYITTAGKILAKGAAYVEKETLRLEGLLSKGHILATKRTNMMIRKNILAVFA